MKLEMKSHDCSIIPQWHHEGLILLTFEKIIENQIREKQNSE